MKFILSALLTLVTFQILKAQNNTITGSVQAETGKLLHFVYVGDNDQKNAVFTDSLGNFSLNVHPDSKILFQSEGYRDTSIKASELSTGAQVILKSIATVPVQTTNLSIRAVITEGGYVAIPQRKANMVGSRYQFGTFTHGFFTDTKGRQIYNRYYLFNYEKISGYLLMTVDRSNIMKIDKDQIKSFTLYDNSDQRHEFERLPAVDTDHFAQVLANGDRYKIYKLTKTQYEPSDVVHTAAGTSGKEYDEYVDDNEYYLLDVKSKQLKKLSLKKKSIKTDFAKEEDKVNKFMSENSGSIDDAYLSNLGSYMNR